jgi:hypothetical protein
MHLLRRFVLFLLLLTVPFQAALGATGLLCATGAHHPQQVAAAPPHDHDAGMAGEHHHHAGTPGSHDDSVAEPGSHQAHGAADKCKICSECCFTSAAIPASPLAAFPPDTPLRVSSIVDPDIVSRAGDGLFRPPRTTAV